MTVLATGPVNVAWTDEFFVRDADGNGVAGISSGAFTTVLTKAGVASAVTVTITEAAAAGGLYEFSFTPTSTGLWKIRISHSSYGQWEGTIRVLARDFDDHAFPATSGRSLAVTAAGQVGLDWANIGSPSTSQNLSATTIATVTNAVTTALDGLLVRSGTAQAGSTSGTIVLDAGASSTAQIYNNNVVVITSGTGAGQQRVITGYNGGSSKTAAISPAWTTTPDNTSVFKVVALPGVTGPDWGNVQNQSTGVSLSSTGISTVSGTVGGVSGNVVGNLTGSVGSVARLEARGNNTCQAGSTSTTIVLDSGASATTDIYKWCVAIITGGTGAGQAARIITAYNGATKTATVTPAWTTTPDATTSFVIINLAGITAADARFWLGTAPNALVSGRVDASIGAVASGVIAAASFASGALGAVWDELTASHTTASTFGKLLGAIALSAAGNVKADLEEWRSSVPNALVSSNVPANVSSITAAVIAAASFAANAIDSNAFAQAAADKVWSTAARALTDKANFTLSTAGIQAIWDALTANLTTVGSVGKRIADNLDATVSSRLASASYTSPPSVASIAAAILATPSNLLATDASGRVTVGSIVANAIDAAQITAGAAQFVADGLLDRAAAIDSTLSVRKTLRDIWASVAGVTTGEPSTNPTTLKGPSGNTALTVTYDANNNRTSSVSS